MYSSRLGVDVGGTYTDLVFYDEETGELRAAKNLTTSGAPDKGVIDVVYSTLSNSYITNSSLFLHATTLPLNTLLQRNGAVVGLVTTKGFRDILEYRRMYRGVLNDPLWRPVSPLISRRLRVEVEERILADGTIYLPLSEDELQNAVKIFLEEGVDSIAVVFLHSYRNPEHELKASEYLKKYGFEGDIVLSHQVSGEYREYERTSTAVIDAYVRPNLSKYLKRLEKGIRKLGYKGHLLATTSGGGSVYFSDADEHPSTTIESGPAAGAIGTAEVCHELGIALAIMGDVGGTSFDVSLIVNGEATIKHEGEVAGFPVQTPWVDVRSIGAGGGSIAYIDDLGMLRVGSRSAGSNPGPVCYGRGGTEPTSTDAAAMLGMLGFGELDGGIQLDIEAAYTAFEAIAKKLGISVDNAATGALQIASSNMANAIREVVFEQGYDPRESVLFFFGGAGGMFAILVAQELGIPTVVIPNHAGVFSAWGLLGMDLTQSSAKTLLRPLDNTGLTEANIVAGDLVNELEERSSKIELPGIANSIKIIELDIRYIGQEYPLKLQVPFDDGRIKATPAEIEEFFFEEASRAYGYKRRAPLEIVSVRATLKNKLPRRQPSSPTGAEKKDRAEEIEVFSFSMGIRCPFKLQDRSALPVDVPVEGPMIISERTTTTYVDAGWQVTLHPTGNMFLKHQGWCHHEE